MSYSGAPYDDRNEDLEGVAQLVEAMMRGEVHALSRLISLVERDGPETAEIMKMINPCLGNAYLVGITGPPGSGKSTLVNRLTAIARSKGLSVGVIAVDPTSPFSGGAMLGDRIRMNEHTLDPGVFIRSMASRGAHGGLTQAVRSVVRLFDAFGKRLIVEETVGVGQTELDVVNTADTVVVVLVPEAGDTIQALKAGLMEIAHIFVINKADREGAERLRLELESALSMQSRKREWEPPVVLTQAIHNVGIDELYQALEKHREYLLTTGELADRRQRRCREELLSRVEQRLLSRFRKLVTTDEKLIAMLERVAKGEMDVFTATDDVYEEVMAKL